MCCGISIQFTIVHNSQWRATSTSTPFKYITEDKNCARTWKKHCFPLWPMCAICIGYIKECIQWNIHTQNLILHTLYYTLLVHGLTIHSHEDLDIQLYIKWLLKLHHDMYSVCEKIISHEHVSCEQRYTYISKNSELTNILCVKIQI